MFDVNWLAVFVAAFSAFMLGGLWYSPAMFLKPWLSAWGKTMDDKENGHPARVFGLSFAFAFLSAWALAYLLGPAPDWERALTVSGVVGFAMVAASFGINYQFSNHKISLWLIDGGYHLAQFAIYGAIFALWS